VLHGLREHAVSTYEVDCFLADGWLVTIHDAHAVSISVLSNQVRHRPDLARASIDEIAGLLADVMTRRLLSVLEAFDDRVEGLVAKALTADATLLEELTAVRTDLAGVRRVVKPQREALDVLRHSTSHVVTDAGRRRFSDVFDVASRLATGLDEARSALAETLDAYRGAEARQATEVTKVLTVYAAIMLPLSLIAGIFGMNFVNLPLLDRRWGWVVVAVVMLVVAFVSLGVFISLGWIRRPSGRRTGAVLGRGLLEASLAPVQIVGAVVEMSTMPLRATGTKLRQVVDTPDSPLRRMPGLPDASIHRDSPDDPDDAAHHGSE
jgi:magnesium transporter